MKRIFAAGMRPDREALVRRIGAKIGAETVHIDSSMYGIRISELTEADSYIEASDKDGEKTFNMEMIIFDDVSSRELDIFLDWFRKTGEAPVPLKAQVTETNRTWTVSRLYAELGKEYLFYKMKKK